MAHKVMVMKQGDVVEAGRGRGAVLGAAVRIHPRAFGRGLRRPGARGMKILFVHQNFPGQFLHLAPALAARGHDCRALTDSTNQRASSIPVWRYRHGAEKVDPAATRLGRNYTTMSDRGVTVARAALQLREKEGYMSPT
jgi:hypothetical protein